MNLRKLLIVVAAIVIVARFFSGASVLITEDGINGRGLAFAAYGDVVQAAIVPNEPVKEHDDKFVPPQPDPIPESPTAPPATVEEKQAVPPPPDCDKDPPKVEQPAAAELPFQAMPDLRHVNPPLAPKKFVAGVLYLFTVVDKRTCPFCQICELDLKSAGVKYQEVTGADIPKWVQPIGTPVLYWQASDGEWKKSEGWNPGKLNLFLAEYRNSTRAMAAAPQRHHRMMPKGADTKSHMTAGELVEKLLHSVGREELRVTPSYGLDIPANMKMATSRTDDTLRVVFDGGEYPHAKVHMGLVGTHSATIEAVHFTATHLVLELAGYPDVPIELKKFDASKQAVDSKPTPQEIQPYAEAWSRAEIRIRRRGR